LQAISLICWENLGSLDVERWYLHADAVFVDKCRHVLLLAALLLGLLSKIVLIVVFLFFINLPLIVVIAVVLLLSRSSLFCIGSTSAILLAGVDVEALPFATLMLMLVRIVVHI